MRHCFAIGLVLVSLAAAVRAGTFTVDDDAPADFVSIVAAVDAASPGDVLLVMPGVYDGFLLGKPLTIIGPGDGPRPRVLGTTIINTSSFTLAGLSLEHLRVNSVEGPARLDDCFVGSVTAMYQASLDVLDCDQLLVTRSIIDGQTSLPGAAGIGGFLVRNSTYALVDCAVFGGDPADPIEHECTKASHGAAFADTCEGQLTASSLIGGHGGISVCTEVADSKSGFGLVLFQGHHDLRGGTALSAGPPFTGWNGNLGSALGVVQATLLIEPGTVGTGGLSQSQSLVLTAADPEPTLLVSADTPQVPGGFGQLRWTAPDGAPGILLISLGGALASFQKIETPIWTASPALLALPIVAGPGTTSLDYHLPREDELIGTLITLQALFPTVPGAVHPNKVAVTNPTQLVIRF